jgi:prephenate dehydrogenase
MFNRLCIIGLGLIGGSIARAARNKGLCREIVALGQDIHLADLKVAHELGVIDQFYTDAFSALNHADCVIIATPVGAVKAVFEQIAPYWQADVVYSDACSTKASVVAAAVDVFGKLPANFVPAHPIAGAERSGVEASTNDLFNHKRLIITPLAETDDHALQSMIAFWEQIGGKVSIMSVDRHDAILAATSHLPHILAFALVNLLGHKDEQIEIFKYAAGGFKDFSRIASSDPTMWLDISLANKQEIIPLIQQLQMELNNIKQLLENNQSQQLFETFAYAGSARQRFIVQLED